MTKPKLVWEAPPPKASGRNAAARKLALAVAARPNQWVRIAVYRKEQSAHDRGSRIRTGKVKGFADIGTFEVKVREIPEGWGVWVRCTYVKKAGKEALDEQD